MRPKQFTVWEHHILRIGDKNEKGQTFDSNDIQVLVEYYGANDVGMPYFSLGYQCILFAEYVGVLQVGHLTIEVLPKTDNANSNEWRDKLIQILKKVQGFDVSVTGSSLLSLKSNSILEYYFILFLFEVKKLLHQGLVKKYRSVETNNSALKGSLIVSKQISYNCVHRERFFVRHTIYDKQNIFNQIIYKTLKLINALSRDSAITTNVAQLLLDFPEMKDVKVSEGMFDRLHFDRKTEGYKTAVEIAKLLLLRYHPDLKQGSRQVLALMFDMNLLWEKFVYVTLKRHLNDFTVKEQVSKPYWKMEGYRSISLKPDIKLSKGDNHYIIDTKWKMLNNKKPSYQDLQQMFAYTKYFSSLHTILLYPGNNNELKKGFFHHETEMDKNYPCSIGIIALDGKDSIYNWQVKISNQVRNYIQEY